MLHSPSERGLASGASRSPFCRIRRTIGEYNFAGQYQQSSAPLGGGFLTAADLFWMPCWVGAEVEVDRETGKVQVVHLVVGADSGRSVNTIACRGQVEGAALQALGQSLFEELRYEDGKPVNATPLDYACRLRGIFPTNTDRKSVV